MQNIYPLFEPRRLLKTELFWSLRDYSFDSLRLEYQGYTDGILRGCEVTIYDRELAVGTGMVKYNGFIYLIKEELRIAYEPTEKWEILKMKMRVKQYASDYITYELTLHLETGDEAGTDSEKRAGTELEKELGNEPDTESGIESGIEFCGDELEVCRFKLRKGAVLRSRYQDFNDMSTEYDTVNLLNASWAALGGTGLAPALTGYFSRLVLAEKNSRTEDINFAYLCLNTAGSVAPEMVSHYIIRRLGMEEEKPFSNQERYRFLAEILENIHYNRESQGKREKKRRQIIVD